MSGDLSFNLCFWTCIFVQARY